MPLRGTQVISNNQHFASLRLAAKFIFLSGQSVLENVAAQPYFLNQLVWTLPKTLRWIVASSAVTMKHLGRNGFCNLNNNAVTMPLRGTQVISNIHLGCKAHFFLWPKCLGEHRRQALFLKLPRLDTAKIFGEDSGLHSCLGGYFCCILNCRAVTKQQKETQVLVG